MLTKTILLFLAATTLTSQAVSYNGHDYQLITANTWAGAEADAVALGGHLATINDAAEEAFIRTTFGTDRIWIGYTDQAAEGTWVWSSGEVTGYENWGASEPNNLGNEDFAVMNWILSGEWNDVQGSFQTIGVAEINPRVSTPDGGATASLLGLGVFALTVLRRKL